MSALLALYHLGDALVQGDNTTGKIGVYKRFVSSYGTHKILLRCSLYPRLGYGYVLDGDCEQATKAFLVVPDVSGALNRDQALFELGKLEGAQSRPEAVMVHYQDLRRVIPPHPRQAEATVHIKALQVKRNHETGATEGQEGTATVAEPGK